MTVSVAKTVKRHWLMNEYGETGGEVQPGKTKLLEKKRVQVSLHSP
jgi:hypothetical protein